MHIIKNFLDNKNGKIVYQNDEFVFLESEDFRVNILKEIHPKKGFSLDDEYISSSDMILKVNFNENRIHVWSMIHNYESTCLMETLDDLREDKQSFLQETILKQFTLNNTTTHGDNYDI